MQNSTPPDFSSYCGTVALANDYVAAQAEGGQAAPVLVVSLASERACDLSGVYKSLRVQTFQSWQWLVCYDGNSDEQLSAAFIAEVAKDERVLLRPRAECASTSAVWSAFDYVVLVDAKTQLKSTFIEKAIWSLVSNPEFAFCNSLGMIPGEHRWLINHHLSEGKHYLASAQLRVRAAVFRSSVLLETFSDIAILSDGRDPLAMLSCLADKGYWGYTIPEYLQWCAFSEVGHDVDSDQIKAGKAIPQVNRRFPSAYETLPVAFPFRNPLKRNASGRRVMFLLPWMVEGGADRVNIDLIEGLVAGGADVTVCATLEADHRWLGKFAELTRDVFVLPNFLSLSDFPRFILYLIESRSIDTVLIAGSTLGYQLLPYLRTMAPETAFVDLCHTEEMHWLNGGHPRFAVGYQDALDLNVVSTRHLSDWMERLGADPEKIRVMYTGIKSHPVSLSEGERGAVLRGFALDEQALTIIFAGRMCDQKRPLKLAEILSVAKQKGVRFNALVIGEGELRPAFESLIAQYDLGTEVRVLGAKAHADWLSLLAVSDVLLMPSEYEGISVALIESMAAGVVPVVADVGGQDELVGAETGYLVQHGEDEVARYVQVLQELAADAETRRRKALACRQLIEANYTAAATSRQWLEIMDEARANRKHSSQPFLPLGLAREIATNALENRRVTSYLDHLYSTHCLTNEAQTAAPFNQGILAFLIAKVRRNRWARFIFNRPLIRRVARRLKVSVS